jgi:hypothetical protein
LDKFWSRTPLSSLRRARRAQLRAFPVSGTTETLLFERFRVALSRESTRLMPFLFPETPVAYKALDEDKGEVAVFLFATGS